MSVQVMTWVFHDAPKDLDPSETLVALVLAEHANPEGGMAYPSVSRIADMAKISTRQVTRALGSLVERGIVSVEHPATNKRPTVYRFIAFRPDTVSSQQKARGDMVSGLGGHGVRSRGDMVSAEPSLEPSMNRQEDIAASGKQPYTQAFEEFWQRYPRTNGAKADAYARWKQLKPVDRAAAAAGLQKWIDSEHWRDGYVVYAQRYLKSRMWENEPAPKHVANGREPPGLDAARVKHYQELSRAHSYQGPTEDIPR